MSIQVGDCFKILWPFQNVRTLSIYHHTIGLVIAIAEVFFAFFDQLFTLYDLGPCKYNVLHWNAMLISLVNTKSFYG